MDTVSAHPLHIEPATGLLVRTRQVLSGSSSTIVEETVLDLQTPAGLRSVTLDGDVAGDENPPPMLQCNGGSSALMKLTFRHE